MAARLAHNQKILGSSPSPATKYYLNSNILKLTLDFIGGFLFFKIQN